MRAVVQRVLSASVSVEGKVVGEIGQGLLVLLAAHRSDTEREAAKMADRVFGLRIFNDEAGKMNLSLANLLPNIPPLPADSHPNEEKVANPEERGPGGEVPKIGVLAVSNFTVYGETAKNRRPSFIESAPYAEGESLFNEFVRALRALECPVEQGVFGADMKVSLVNDGPVTVILDVTPIAGG